MAFSDELLKDSLLNEEVMAQDFEALRSYYEAMEIKTQLIPATKALPLPTLIAVVTSEEEDEPPLVITHSFLPLDKEEAEFTKYLQYYTELPNAVEELDRLTLLEALNRLNQTLPLSHVILLPPRPQFEKPVQVGVRYLQGYKIDEVIDQGVFTEDVILFELSCDLTSVILDELRDGSSIDEAFSVIGR